MGHEKSSWNAGAVMNERRIALIHRRVAFLACLCLAAARLPAQTMNIGPEFVVNTYTTDSKTYAAVAAATDGSFVVVWTSNQPEDSDFGVFGQRFSPLGAKVGGEFHVNTYTHYFQGNPAIAMDSQGNFTVVWVSLFQDGSSHGVYGQRFDADAAPLGGEFLVNMTTTGQQIAPAIAMAADGRFVVAWSKEFYQPESNVWGQAFAASGVKTGGEFRVNTYTTDSQSMPAVAADAAGRFVIVWQKEPAGVLGQRFDAFGKKVGPEFPVSTSTTSNGEQPAIAMDRAGNFVVLWRSNGIVGQRFNSGAERVGDVFAVDTFTATGSPRVAFERDGGFVAVWESNGEIAARRFDKTGAPAEPKFILNTTSANTQRHPAIAAAPAGVVLGFWESPGVDGDGNGVIGRRQRLEPFALLADAHGDGGSDENGVIEPGELVRIEPTWRNRGPGIAKLEGTLSDADFFGPPGPNYTIFDRIAGYASIFVGSATTCGENPDPCFAVQVSGDRPAPHWDATMRENLSLSGSVDGSQVWTLHIGDSFPDVPRTQPFYKKIETLLHHGITKGCNATQYCPLTVVSRDAMAIFIAKGIAGSGEYVPAAGQAGASVYNCSAGGHSLFGDVPPTAPFCKHVHYLAAQNVTLGCNATQYCPGQSITRDAMASFIAKAIVAPGGGVAVPATYTDPTTARSYSCVSGSANLHFSDVTVANPFCKHIHFLWAKGIVDGCTATAYCPASPVARDAMAKFIANGFGLKLYGP
jgi:hypothetical protein